MREASTSSERVKHGCLIVRGSSVLGRATNSLRNDPGSPVEASALGYHAEVNALRQVKQQENLTAYIARVNNQGQARPSRPCPDCMTRLKAAGVRRIVYTVSNEEMI